MLKITFLLFTMILCESLVARQIDLATLEVTKSRELPERYVKANETYVLLTFPNNQPSTVIQALGNENSLPLYERIMEVDGTPSYQVAQEVAIPAEAKKVLLIGWKGQKGANYLAIEDHFSNSTQKDCILVNTTATEIHFQIGNENDPLQIAPNAIVSHKIKSVREAGLSVTGKTMKKDKLKPFYSTYWPAKDSEQTLLVLFYEQDDRITLRKINSISQQDQPTE